MIAAAYNHTSGGGTATLMSCSIVPSMITQMADFDVQMILGCVGAIIHVRMGMTSCRRCIARRSLLKLTEMSTKSYSTTRQQFPTSIDLRSDTVTKY